MSAIAIPESCDTILVSCDRGVVSIMRNGTTFVSLIDDTSGIDHNAPCGDKFYIVRFGDGSTEASNNVPTCCSTRFSTYLITINHDTSESSFGSFSLLVPLVEIILQYLHGREDVIEGPWKLAHRLALFSDEAVVESSLSIIQNSLGTLEAIARVRPLLGEGNDLLLGYEFRSETGWRGPVSLRADDGPLDHVTGSQALALSNRSGQLQLQLLVPRGDVIGHYTHDTEEITDTPWNFFTKLPPVQGGLQVLAISLIQSGPDQLAAIARVAPPNSSVSSLVGYVLNQGSVWEGPFELRSDVGPINNVTGQHAFIQSGENTFELLVPIGPRIIDCRFEQQTFPQEEGRFIAALNPPENNEQIQPVSLALTRSISGNLELAARVRPPYGEDFMVGYVYNQETNSWQGPSDLLDENGQRIVARSAEQPRM
jgi:hypothetical protein